MDTLFQTFDNITFSDLWDTKEKFISDYNEIGFPKENYQLDDETLELIWLLLIGRFADSTIKPYNTFGAFKVRFMSRVWQHAPAWKKKLEIQNELRKLSLDSTSAIYDGSKAIFNNAMNPGIGASETGIDGELNFINQQNTTKYKRSKLEGISMLSELLKNDVTEEFLRRFDDLFKSIIYTGRELTYLTYNEGDN